jgi:tetratricopeptide (TPR) repeat protein
MTHPDPRRRLADALSVTWTSALEAETKARIDGAVVSARRRRKRAVKVSALLATVCAAGLVFAFSRGLGPRDTKSLRRERVPARVAAPPAPAPPAAEPAPAAIDPTNGSPVPAALPADRAAPRRTRPVAPREAAPSAADKDPIEELFRRADRARLAGFPNEALEPLTEIQERFPTDRRAAVAAFQLGRILADELGDPARAARAFERARALAPFGPLARDAQARAEQARRAAAARETEPATP